MFANIFVYNLVSNYVGNRRRTLRSGIGRAQIGTRVLHKEMQ